MRMKVYQSKPRITLSPAIRDGQKYVEVEFDDDDAIRLSLSKEKGVRFEGDRAYLPEEGFDLSGFFDRHVETAYINYSALKNTLPKKSGKTSPAIPPGYAETLRQLRYSEHTVRAYTAYFKEFQQYFAGRNLRYIRPEEINAYIVHLIDTRGDLVVPTELAHQLDQVLFREGAGTGTEMLRGKASQTGTDAARRAEQGGDKIHP